MSDLAACYFCGAALDEPLTTVRLGDGATVTLCAGCEEKLETVLDAVEGESSVDEAPAESPSPGDESDATADSEDSADAEVPAGAADTSGDDAGDEPDAATAASDDAADGERSIVEGDQEISALEYNKVMRLLQNREFPVDRDEIVTVAANAYQVSRADCDRVIDVAIDRGLIDEADGELVRPD